MRCSRSMASDAKAASRIALVSVFLSRLAQFAIFPFIYSILIVSGSSTIVAGFVVALSAVSSALIGLLGGLLADRRDEIIITALCNLALAIALLLLTLSFAVHILILFSLVFGAIQGFLDPATQLSLAKQKNVVETRKSFGARYYAINLAAAIGPILGALIFEYARVEPIISVSFLLLLAASLAVRFRQQRDRSSQNSARAASLAEIGKALRDYRTGIFAVTLIMVSYSQMTTTFSHYIVATLGLRINFYAALMVFHAAIIILVQPLVLAVLARSRFNRTISLGMISLSIGLILPAVAGNTVSYIDSRVLLFLAMFCFTIGEILVLPSSNALFAELSPQETKALVLSLFNLSRLGLAVGPILGSVIVEALGFSMLCGFSAALVLVGVSILIRISRFAETVH